MNFVRPAISVIVPVYNVELYLHECIDSILSQTFTDFELILVDDGSPDNCGAICDEYAAKDSRIVVIHQENGGLSAARNAGMDIAQGEYIAFVDSDDYIAPEFLNHLYLLIQKTAATLSTCRLLSGGEFDDIYSAQFRVIEGREAALQVERIGVEVCGKLFHNELIKDFRFPVGKICEDRAYTPYALYWSDTVAVSQAKLYFYRIREGSIMHQTISAKRYDDIQHIDDYLQYMITKNEDAIIAETKVTRKRHLATYTLQAAAAGVKDIPKKYKMSKIRALMIAKSYYKKSLFHWYLIQIYPWLGLPVEYCQKIESLFKGKAMMGEEK